MSNSPRADHYRAELDAGKYLHAELVMWLLDEFADAEIALAAKEKEIHRLKAQLKQERKE
jgi:hypothetical protein